MRLVYQQASMTRVISFEYLNRQLMWQELSEVLLFMLPLLDAVRIRRVLATWLPRLPSPAALLGLRAAAGAEAGAETGSAGGGKGGTEAATAAAGAAQELPRHCCPICASTDVLLPFRALPCQHVFCYYCLRANCEADVGFCCPLDGSRVAAMARLSARATVAS